MATWVFKYIQDYPFYILATIFIGIEIRNFHAIFFKKLNALIIT